MAIEVPIESQLSEAMVLKSAEVMVVVACHQNTLLTQR